MRARGGRSAGRLSAVQRGAAVDMDDGEEVVGRGDGGHERGRGRDAGGSGRGVQREEGEMRECEGRRGSSEEVGVGAGYERCGAGGRTWERWMG